VVAGCAAHTMLATQERMEQNHILMDKASRDAGLIMAEINDSLNSAVFMRAFFNASDEVTKSEFSLFAGEVLDLYP